MILLSEVSFWALGSLLLEIFVGLSSPLAFLTSRLLHLSPTSLSPTSLSPTSPLAYLSLAFLTSLSPTPSILIYSYKQ